MAKDWKDNRCFRKFDFSGKGIDLHDPKDIIIGNYPWRWLCMVSAGGPVRSSPT